MSRASVLARARAAAEAGMVDTCVITRVASVGSDKETGQTIVNTTTVYSGVCRVQQRSPTVRSETVGEAYRLMLALELHLPASATGIEAEDAVTVTASAHDPDLVGRVFRVRQLAHKSHASARRVGIEEETS